MTRSSPVSPSGPEPSALFDALVLEHYAGLCRFAYRMVRSREVAEDIVQDVFAEMWCRWGELEVKEPLPYLCRAIRNRVINYRRQWMVRNRWQHDVTAQSEARAERRTTATDAEMAELHRALDAAVEGLPERTRLVFLMSREQDLTYAQIAQGLGISVKTVETQMSRALRLLRTRLAGFLGAAAAVSSLWRAAGG